MTNVDPREYDPPLAPELFVPDVAASVDFWTEKLGFALLRDEMPRFAVLELYGAIVMFCDESALESRVEPACRGAGAELRIMVPDADEMRRRVNDAGIEFHRDISDRDYGLRDFVIRDPNGYRVRFATPLDQTAVP